MSEKLIGCHLSSSKGFTSMANTAKQIGATTFQFFSRNPRGTKAKALNEKDIQTFKSIWTNPFVCHAPYTLNLCSAKPDLRELAVRIMIDDLKRLEIIGCPYYNIHPGSHTGQGATIAIDQISSGINEIMSIDGSSMLLLETMAGKGSEVGRSFEELKAIRDNVENKNRVGFLIDTCHIFDGGYDIKDNLFKVIDEFDNLIGIENLKAIHLNDSLNILGSRKDRHARLKEGNISQKAIEQIVNNPQLKTLPFILETPNELDGYRKEIEYIKSISV